MKSVIVGTAGHIDHGKSTLVLALTGTDPDRLQEEKARGITIDLGFAHLAIGDVQFAFVDVPGHERFVKNMLAGVGGIDLVVLVVAADESVMPQTREHFAICRLLRVPAGLIALTKADLVDADTLELVKLEVRELVAGSFLGSAPIVPVSARTGEGLDRFREALAEAATRVAGRPVSGPARLPIDRVFSMKGFGTVVTGTLVSGRVRVDDELVVAPGGRAVKVRGVQVHGTKQAGALAGQRTAVNLGGIEVEEIERGQSLVARGTFTETRVVDASIETLADVRPLRHGARVRVHQGTAEILGRIAIVGPTLAGDGGRTVPALEPGTRGFVRLRLERPALLTRGDRYIVRAYSPPMTIAGGQVLDPCPPRSAIRTAAALERCRRLDIGDDSGGAARLDADTRAATVMLADAGASGLPIQALVSRAAIEPPALETFVSRLGKEGIAIRAGDMLVAKEVYDALMRGIGATLTAHHKAQPLSEGMPREELRERVYGRGPAIVFERAVDEMMTAGTVGGRERLALTTHRVALSPEEEKARTVIERMFREAGLKPPDLSAAAGAAGVSPAVADRVAKLLHRQKVLVRIETIWFHDEALKGLKTELAAMKATRGAGAQIDVGTFKERFGVSRKFAIPLLEYLDRERVTRRVGDQRVLL